MIIPHQATEAPLLKDAKLFVSNNEIYEYSRKLQSNHKIISHKLYIISLTLKTGHWSQIQHIETFGVHSMD